MNFNKIMSELDLYKFIESSKAEIHIYYYGQDQKDMRLWSNTDKGWEILIFINPCNLSEFTKMLGYSHFDDGGIDAKLLYDGSVGLDLMPIMDSFNINLANIFHKDNHFVKR